MADRIEWVAVEGSTGKLIGAVGFIGDKAVAVAAFYDDADANQDGKVSTGEWVGSKMLFNLHGRAVTEVAMQARYDLDIAGRDGSFNEMAAKIFQSFALGLIAQGVYISYFSQGVSLAGSSIASKITGNMVKQLVIRKSFEATVKKVFLKGVGY